MEIIKSDDIITTVFMEEYSQIYNLNRKVLSAFEETSKIKMSISQYILQNMDLIKKASEYMQKL